MLPLMLFLLASCAIIESSTNVTDSNLLKGTSFKSPSKGDRCVCSDGQPGRVLGGNDIIDNDRIIFEDELAEQKQRRMNNINCECKTETAITNKPPVINNTVSDKELSVKQNRSNLHEPEKRVGGSGRDPLVEDVTDSSLGPPDDILDIINNSSVTQQGHDNSGVKDAPGAGAGHRRDPMVQDVTDPTLDPPDDVADILNEIAKGLHHTKDKDCGSTTPVLQPESG